MTASETVYAIIENGTITNLVVCSDPSFAESQEWIGPIVPSSTIQIGSTTPDNGKTFSPPPQSAPDPNVQALLGWIKANPNGGALTPAVALALVNEAVAPASSAETNGQ